MDFIGQILNFLLEAIDFSLELINSVDRGGSIAVRFAVAPSMAAAETVTLALVVVVPALVRAKPVICLVVVAVTCLRYGTDGSDGNCKFHFCVGSLFLIC